LFKSSKLELFLKPHGGFRLPVWKMRAVPSGNLEISS
jgi:hypothetical protein